MSVTLWIWYSYKISAEAINNYITKTISLGARVFWTFSNYRDSRVKEIWMDSKMVKLQLHFFSKFYIYAFGNQYSLEWKLIAIFVDLEYKSTGLKDFGQNADQHEKVLQLYHLQSETKLVVSMDENFGKRYNHQHVVKVFFFNSWFWIVISRSVHYYTFWEMF